MTGSKCRFVAGVLEASRSPSSWLFIFLLHTSFFSPTNWAQ